eukprot:365957-Hanusia_phi.AAC.1
MAGQAGYISAPPISWTHGGRGWVFAEVSGARGWVVTEKERTGGWYHVGRVVVKFGLGVGRVG